MCGPVLYKLLMMENQEEKGMKWMEMRKNSVPVIKSRESGKKNKTANTSKEQSGRRQLLAGYRSSHNQEVCRVLRKKAFCWTTMALSMIRLLLDEYRSLRSVTQSNLRVLNCESKRTRGKEPVFGRSVTNKHNNVIQI